MGEIKEVLLQMLVAGLPAFLFPLSYGKSAADSMPKEGAGRKNPIP